MMPESVDPERLPIDKMWGFISRYARQLDAVRKTIGYEKLDEKLDQHAQFGKSADEKTIKSIKRSLNPPPKPAAKPEPFSSGTFLPFDDGIPI